MKSAWLASWGLRAAGELDSGGCGPQSGRGTGQTARIGGVGCGTEAALVGGMLNEWIDEVTYVLGRIGYDAATFRYPADRKRGPFHTLALRGGDVAWYDEAGRWYGDYAKGDRPALGCKVQNAWV